jgi:hypothetical protein
MGSVETYEGHAEHCLRMALAKRGRVDRSLWLALAHSWMQLAHDAQRLGLSIDLKLPSHAAPTKSRRVAGKARKLRRAARTAA